MSGEQIGVNGASEKRPQHEPIVQELNQVIMGLKHDGINPESVAKINEALVNMRSSIGGWLPLHVRSGFSFHSDSPPPAWRRGDSVPDESLTVDCALEIPLNTSGNAIGLFSGSQLGIKGLEKAGFLLVLEERVELKNKNKPESKFHYIPARGIQEIRAVTPSLR